MSLFHASRLLELVVFVTLAAVSAGQWRRVRSEGAMWLTLTFSVLSGAVLVAVFLPDTATRDAGDQGLMRGALMLLVLFPYCLFRFGASFHRRAARVELVARVLVAVLVLSCAALPHLPGPVDPVPWWFLAFTVALVLDWTALSCLVVGGLWRAGAGQPSVVRHRMRMLGGASVALNVALLFALDRGPRASVTVDLVTQGIILSSGALFLLAFAPPRWLRTVWRREEMDLLRPAEAALMVARSPAEVGEIVPHAARLVGAVAAVLTDPGGRLVARYGVDEAGASGLAVRGRLPSGVGAAVSPEARDVVTVALGAHRLTLSASAATPLFGRDELAVLERLGHLAGLALDRADLVARDESARSVLAEREAQLADAQATAQLGSYSWDLVTGEVSWSREMHRLLGFAPGEVEDFGRAFASRIHADDTAAVHEAWAAARAGAAAPSMEFRVVLPGGAVRWLHGRARTLEGADGTAVRLVGTLQDVTERRESEEAVAFQALHDSLTGLPNRRLFLDRLGHALAVRARRSSGLAVLFLDLDRFKWLNDSLGHAAGDELLVEVASRLGTCLRPGDTVARFGGDEFVILCEDVDGEASAERLALRFASEVARPVVVAGEETIVTASIGIAYSPPSRNDDTADTLLRDADSAMYQAKDRGRDRFETFDADTRLVAVARHETANALRRGMERGELVVHYQPQIDLTTGRVVGVEALVRWRHPERGLLAPSEFIPLAEETGLIVPLGVQVLSMACHQVQAWQPEDGAGPPLSLSVNLSARQLMAADLCEVVEAALSSSGLDPSLLCLEITESVLLGDAVASARALHRLKALGVDIGVDDFGTGFSSLTYLKRFPVDILKIDRSFVEGLGCNREDRAIVASVVDLAHAFGLTTIAEGVETIGQLGELRGLGCEQGQGYLWSAPLDAAETGRWIAAQAGPSEAVPFRRLSLVPATTGRRRHRILIVDDDRSARRLLRILFETDDDFEVVGEADDGREAIALARHHSPDLVLLDLAMPGMGGLEALPLILAVAPAAKVAVLSGLDAADVAHLAARQGAAAYFAKEGDPDRLPTLLAPLLATA